MYLYISAQDINELMVGLVDDHSLIQEKVVQSDPESFLLEIVELLQEWSISFKDLTAIIVVLGPGSPTSLRVTVTIANTIGFVREIPVIGLINPDRLNAKDLISDVKTRHTLSLQSDSEFKPLSPFYDRPAV